MSGAMVADHLKNRFILDFAPEVIDLVEADNAALDDLAGASGEALAHFADRAEPVLLMQLFERLDDDQKAELIEQAAVRTSLTLLRSLDDDARQAFYDRLPAARQASIAKIESFPEDMAGHYTDSTSARYTIEDTVESALQKLRASRVNRTRSLYVVDDRGVLQGRVDLQDIALADAGTRLSALINAVQGIAQLTTPRDELIEIFNRYRVDSIPIVDQDNHLSGVVRYASLFQAAEESLTGDLQMMVGVSPEERALSPASFAVKKRLPWLHINLLTAFLAAAVVGVFESTIAQFTALAILLPVVAGQSGNAGSQALAVTMRGLALREINLAKWRQVLMKEIKVGMVDGVALAITCGLGVFVWSQSLGLAVVIGIAMIISMIMAGVSGALVPMLLIRFGQDPATASSIILTTVTDVSGFISFLGTATLLAAFL